MKWHRFEFSTISRLLSKLPGFSRPEKYSLGFLNVAQFFGALNDNIYKLVLIFFLIQLQGPDHANRILSAAGAIFVIPFLLFSSLAGLLADHFSKSRLLMLIKSVEILTMLLVVLSFALKQATWGYALLFLLATHSAFFGPSKYGIIPELVPKEKVSKANGLITSFTYLAIILGTFLASFLTEKTNGNYVLIGWVCVLFALIGFLATFGIQYTRPKGSTKKIQLFFVQQIYHTLRECREKKHLLIALSGSSFFLFIGAFTQLNIIPFAMQALELSTVAGGYLFLVTALGIALGAFLAGLASKKQIELGLACLSGLVISAAFFTLGFSIHNLPLTVTTLFLLGVAGGNFVVPFDTFIQLFSPEKNRGHVIAATNFFSFVGVLLASFALYLLNEALGLTAAKSFIIMGVLTLLFSLFLIIRLSDLFLAFTARKIVALFFPIEARNLELVQNTKNPLLMLEEASFLKGWLLYAILPSIHLLIPQYKVRRFPWFQRVFYSLHRIDSPQKFEALISHGQSFMDSEHIPCIYLVKKKPVPEKQIFSLTEFFKRKNYEVIAVNFSSASKGRGLIVHFSK